MATLQFELVSPEKLIVSKAVAMVTVPGGEGDYSVLAGHAPLITVVRPGVIDVYDDENGTPVERLFIDGGFAETTAERCTVLAENVTSISQLNRASLEAEALKLQQDVTSVSDTERETAQNALAIINAKLLAAA